MGHQGEGGLLLQNIFPPLHHPRGQPDKNNQDQSQPEEAPRQRWTFPECSLDKAEDTVARYIGDRKLHDPNGSGVLAYPGTFGSRRTGQHAFRSTRAMVSSAATLLLSKSRNYFLERFFPTYAQASLCL